MIVGSGTAGSSENRPICTCRPSGASASTLSRIVACLPKASTETWMPVGATEAIASRT